MPCNNVGITWTGYMRQEGGGVEDWGAGGRKILSKILSKTV